MVWWDMSDMISFSVFQIGILIWVFEAHNRHQDTMLRIPCRFSHLFFGSPFWAKKKNVSNSEPDKNPWVEFSREHGEKKPSKI